MRKILNNKGDISSPIIVILITVAALSITGVTIAWMSSISSKAVSQGSLVIIGTPTITTDGTLYITIKNIGNVNTTIEYIRIGNSLYNSSIIIGANEVYSKPISIGGTFESGKIYNGIIVSSAGTYQFSAICQ
ncbi:MAG: hypothetical protein LM593_04765 [Candidatus Verstraetearchaeota archaeon]|jgi:hypothetical protein|nr:hypothetical protein [Candidatus Verstraetearchaeota archaeon]